MATVAIVITKIHNVTHIDALYFIAFQESKHLKMFITETRTFGFQNVFAHAEKQCWALPQTGTQVHKSANCGLKV